MAGQSIWIAATMDIKMCFLPSGMGYKLQNSCIVGFGLVGICCKLAMMIVLHVFFVFVVWIADIVIRILAW